MVILYTKFFWKPSIKTDSKNEQNNLTSNPSETELNTQHSEHLRQPQIIEKQRKIQQDYHLERRCFW
ncbi:hypothetical protein NIES2119_04105 [[Phormidium ambiguum] IAM M-71]|uniref:Uncharacterized protein n=1 Tax=[Phormidium ambiguum] IAM M-71 TaxID=454136 RepID=A0A1U7IRU2_9CYAN|nr:hypothetical protein [Phormidium ambiguum]OKH40115.1 hypothetical protein NIES2119_04105 [Phormidium ambiguum IAM M-71]